MSSRRRVQRKRLRLDRQRLELQAQKRAVLPKAPDSWAHYPEDHEWGTPIETIKQERAWYRAQKKLQRSIQAYESWRQVGIQTLHPWLAAIKAKHREIETRTQKFLHLFLVIYPQAPIAARLKRRGPYHLQLGSIHDRGPIEVTITPAIHSKWHHEKCLCRAAGRYRSLRAFQYEILLPLRARLSSTFGVCGCSYDSAVPIIANIEPGTFYPSPKLNLVILEAHAAIRGQITFVNPALQGIQLLNDPSVLEEFKELLPPGVAIGLGFGFYRAPWGRGMDSVLENRLHFDLAIKADGAISEHWTQWHSETGVRDARSDYYHRNFTIE